MYIDYKIKPKINNQKIEQRVIECVRPTKNRFLKRGLIGNSVTAAVAVMKKESSSGVRYRGF